MQNVDTDFSVESKLCLCKPFNTIWPRCFSRALYTSMKSFLVFGNSFFFSVSSKDTLNDFHIQYSLGKYPAWNSSQMKQRSTVFGGFAAISVRFLSLSNLDTSFSAKFLLSLKYLKINSLTTSSSLNPSICSRVSQCIRTLIPASCHAVVTTQHFEWFL